MRIDNRSNRTSLILLCALSVQSLAGMALATSTGIVGLSGKQNGVICTACHGGGVAPSVALEGPESVAIGAKATFRLTITSKAAAQKAAGLDVAASGGTLGLVEGQGTRLQLNEVTHTAPKGNDANGAASFEFTWQAPTTPGTYRLFAAGNSVNRNNASSGDAPAALVFDITVAAVVSTPTATATPPPTVTPTNLPATPTATATPTEVPATATPADVPPTATATPTNVPPTATATPTDVPPTATATPTDVPPTATATEAPTDVPTPTGSDCVGDCGNDHEVTVDELITGVNMALGVTSLEVCPLFDANIDGEVTIDEILQAVNSALNGCPTPSV